MQLQCPHCSVILTIQSSAGTQVRCPKCQGEFIVPAMDLSVSEADETTEDEAEEPGESKIPWKVIEKVASWAIGMIFAAAAVFGMVSFYNYMEKDKKPDDGSPYVADGQSNSGNEIQQVITQAEQGEIYVKWIPAKNSASKQGFKVKVHHADWGEVRGRDENGNLIVSPRPFLIVYLELANRSDKTWNFKSWYGNEFVTINGAYRTAQLSDDDKNVYVPLAFEDLKELKWHKPERTFAPKEEATDSIVFDVPEDFNPANIEHLYLDLPGEAIGLSGSYRFKIPRSMIQGI